MPPPPPPKKSSKPSVVAALGQQQPYPPSFPPPPIQSTHFPPPLQQQQFEPTPPAVPQHFKPPAISKHFKPPSLPIQEPPAVIDIPSIVEAPKIPSVLPEAANVLSEVALDITAEGAGPDGEEDTPPVTAKTYSDAFDEEYVRPSLDFDKFISEESSTLTARKIKMVHKKLYEKTKSISYNCLVMIVGFPFIIVWGLLLGITSFAMNWVYIPLLKLVSWLLNATIPVLTPLRNCCKPVMELVAIICKR
ncbi:PREDICTED: pollen-specific leucine-rich repeat extensin-like protein 4 [Amphimedon queenslandica]|uniref:Caveolin n=1 Tax=Amphimedon queenslandica TaxID=400682 RepID=A0A1X7UGA1_AMPQE|nr:PREDICTED: pollen-specific leucine-rich repeat extensin-like protein 4 [Amphimedon queenslandica]XP_019854279.1 PREDICTED: pollen-specific leucine-rich repeat extensin-like protein 4 [Amphimedon queenslandica]|eukprot:XP_019854277.1 PREDICTED: pollen-specific leucine-rich repeat extensin-like protein 4 [Amphimedon queenslandica]